MHRRFKKSDLLRLIGHEATSEEVMHSHAYKKVEKQDGPSLRPRTPYASDQKTIARYRDSMVGSIVQYHDVVPISPRNPEPAKDLVKSEDGIIGNRPSNSLKDMPKKDQASIERRHHFIEPPKRNFP